MIAASGGPRWEDPLWVRDARRALYDGEVANNDASLPALVERLEALGLLDRTAIVMVSDHGEHLGEHGLWDHVPPSYLQVIHVPFLVRMPPGWARTGVVDEPVQLLDLMPTLLDLAGVDAGRLPMQGRSLMPLIRGEVAGLEPEVSVVQEAMRYARPDDPKNVGSLVWGRWHFLHSDKVPTAFFDIIDDREEERPLRVRAELEAAAAALLADLRLADDEIRRTFGGEGSAAVSVDADNLENLAALGYLDD
jgi:choline-sulfatase